VRKDGGKEDDELDDRSVDRACVVRLIPSMNYLASECFGLRAEPETSCASENVLTP